MPAEYRFRNLHSFRKAAEAGDTLHGVPRNSKWCCLQDARFGVFLSLRLLSCVFGGFFVCQLVGFLGGVFGVGFFGLVWVLGGFLVGFCWVFWFVFGGFFGFFVAFLNTWQYITTHIKLLEGFSFEMVQFTTVFPCILFFCTYFLLKF